MRTIWIRFTGMLATGAAVSFLSALPSSAQEFAAKAEIQPISTVTLSSSEFLLGKKDGTPVTIAGELRLPKAGDGRLPAVLIVHGAGGVDARHEAWVRELNSIGVATFILDTFTGRGIANSIADQGRLSSLAMLQDAYRALEVLSKHPRIDPNRIAIMGFSKGGVAGLYASLERFQQAYAPANANFSAYIAFYAGCTTYIDDEKVSNHPIRVYHGAADDWVPPTTCRDYITRLRAQGRDAQFIEFPGAHHAFDKPDEKAPTALPQAQAFRKCRWAENPRGTIINAETGQVFGPNDPCLERGVHVGFDPAAAAAARASVKEFLKATFLLQ